MIPDGFRWFREHLDYLPLYLALEKGRGLSESDLATMAEAKRNSPQFRRDITELLAELCLRRGDLKRALVVSQEHDQLCRNAGLEVAPARTALIFARLEKTSEAESAAEEALSRLSRLHPAQRPHYHLAQTFRYLGEQAQAASYAHDAFRQAWADGPPNCFRWDLVRAKKLLILMGEQVPIPAVRKYDDVKMPREDEIRALVEQLGPV